MKLASLPQGIAGKPVIVSADLAWYADASHIVPSLQAALDEWERHAPALEALATDLEHEAIPQLRFHEREAGAPLPRVYRRTSAGGARPGDDIAAGRSPLRAPCGPTTVELCAVTGEVAQGASADEARQAVRLVGLVHDCGLGALSPVLAVPEVLQQDGIALVVERNGLPLERVALPTPDLGTLVAALAAERRLGPGTLVGSGPLVTIPALAEGDTIRIDLRDGKGHSLLGAIERTVTGG